MPFFQQFTGRTNGQEGFTGTDCTIEKEIFIVGIKIFQKLPAGLYSLFEALQVSSLIIGGRHKVKAIVLQQAIQVRLLVQDTDLLLTKTMTFPAVDIAGVPAVGAVILRLQIVSRKSRFLQKSCFFGSDGRKPFLEGKGGLFSGQLLLQSSIGKIRNLTIQLLIFRNSGVDSGFSKRKLVMVSIALSRVLHHQFVIFFLGKRQGMLLSSQLLRRCFSSSSKS